MAINDSIFAGSETQFGIITAGTTEALGQVAVGQTTFGTTQTVTNWAEAWEVPGVSVDWGIIRNMSVKNDGSRVNTDGNAYYTGSGQVRVISFSDMVVRREDLGVLLYSVLQNVSEAASTPYKKTYVIDETVTQPLFSNDAGFFFTFGIKGPIASYHKVFHSCILRTLTLSPGDDGRLRAAGEIISGFTSNTTANCTGTWEFNEANYYDCYTYTKKQIGGSDIVMYDWSITINNHAVRIGYDSTGQSESYAIATDPAGYDITGTITVKYDAVVQGVIANCISGGTAALEFDIGTDGAAGYFGQKYDNLYYGNVDRNYNTELGQQLVIPFTALHDTGNQMCTLEVDDGLDRGW